MPSQFRRFTGESPPSVSFLLDDQTRMAAARNYFKWQYRLAASDLGQRVVEVGCGTGNFTGFLLERASVIAVDTEPECVWRLRLRYPDQPNLHVECCGPPGAAFLELRRFEPDSCVCLNVIEHIGRDVDALAAMAAILQPGGTIILLAPAFEALYGPIDYQLGHYRRYTKRSLSMAARAARIGCSPRTLSESAWVLRMVGELAGVPPENAIGESNFFLRSSSWFRWRRASKISLAPPFRASRILADFKEGKPPKRFCRMLN